jgi:hypothetical protein
MGCDDAWLKGASEGRTTFVDGEGDRHGAARLAMTNLIMVR